MPKAFLYYEAIECNDGIKGGKRSHDFCEIFIFCRIEERPNIADKEIDFVNALIVISL